MAQAGNALFLHRNLVDEVGVSVTASSEITDAEAAFVLQMDPGEPWRATDKTEEYVSFDFGAIVDATYGAFIYHNCDVQGGLRIRLSNDATFTAPDVYDSGWVDAWDPVTGFGQDRFGATLGGYPVLSAFNDYRPLKAISFGGVRSFRYARMSLRNPTNALITGLSLGRAFIGLGDQFNYNFAFDWTMQWTDPSDVMETELSVRVKRRKSYRTGMLTLPKLREVEALSVWDDIKRTIGNSKDIVIVLFPAANAVKQYRTSLYGLPQKVEGTRNPFLNFYASAMTVRELAA